MPNFQIAYDATNLKAVVQLAADPLPTGYTNVGSFSDVDDNTLGKDSSVAYNHVRDALYRQGVTKMSDVSIHLAPQIVTVTPESATVAVGATVQLAAAVTVPRNVHGVDGVTWTSSATGVATVDANGLVTGVALGTATITATTAFSGKTDTCAITVA